MSDKANTNVFLKNALRLDPKNFDFSRLSRGAARNRSDTPLDITALSLGRTLHLVEAEDLLKHLSLNISTEAKGTSKPVERKQVLHLSLCHLQTRDSDLM